MLRFTPPGDQRLATAYSLDVWVAGSESNIAAAARVLGHTVSWASRLPDNVLGRKVGATLLSLGIDTSQMILQGGVYLEAYSFNNSINRLLTSG